MATNFGQMLAAAQAYTAPQEQRAMAQSQSQQKEFEVEKEKRKQLEELQALMEAEMNRASRGSWLERKLGGFGKILSVFNPTVGAGLQSLSSAGTAARQKKALKSLMKDPKFAKYSGTWLADPTKSFMKDVKGIADDINPFKTGLTSLATSLATGKIAKGVGEEFGGLFKGGAEGAEFIEDASGKLSESGKPLMVKNPDYIAPTFTGGEGGPLKNLLARIQGKQGGFEDFDLLKAIGEGADDMDNLAALPLLVSLFERDEGEDYDAYKNF
tara:strand:- start:9240 stop:10049 length:810 start_codon:yes stop_codon:yes gene_type:complete